MNAIISLVIVLALGGLAALGVGVAGLHLFFGGILPYFAVLLFLGGIIYRVVKWARSPVPFRIPTTSGQQKSLPWIKQSKLDNPANGLQVIGRMILEVLFFRSLFRNTRMELANGDKVVYGPSKWLWLGAMVFHYCFLIVLLRHLRFFTDPIPGFVTLLQDVDGFLQIGAPVIYLSSFGLLAGVTYLFLRRIYIPQVRYVSLASDYFPLFLIMGIAITGILMRHFTKTDIAGIKELTIGLLAFKPIAVKSANWIFFVHIFFVCTLIAYFPVSKLMHMAGVFLSPTRNMANNNRAVHHENPWNYPVKTHTYEEYEDDFRERMKDCGLPVDKE